MLLVIDSSFTAELSCKEILQINHVAEATKAHSK